MAKKSGGNCKRSGGGKMKEEKNKTRFLIAGIVSETKNVEIDGSGYESVEEAEEGLKIRKDDVRFDRFFIIPYVGYCLGPKQTDEHMEKELEKDMKEAGYNKMTIKIQELSKGGKVLAEHSSLKSVIDAKSPLEDHSRSYLATYLYRVIYYEDDKKLDFIDLYTQGELLSLFCNLGMGSRFFKSEFESQAGFTLEKLERMNMLYPNETYEGWREKDEDKNE